MTVKLYILCRKALGDLTIPGLDRRHLDGHFWYLGKFDQSLSFVKRPPYKESIIGAEPQHSYAPKLRINRKKIRLLCSIKVEDDD